MTRVVEVAAAGARYAVPLERVVEIAPRVTITPLPGVAEPVVGYVAYRGEVIAVVDLRLRLGRPAGPPRLDEHLVITRRSARRGTGRHVALLVDRVLSLGEVDEATAHAPPEGAPAVAGIVALDDGLLLVADLDRVLSPDHARATDQALDAIARGS